MENSGGVGGVEANNWDMQQWDRLREMGEAPGVAVATNGGLEAADCNVIRDLGGTKGAALGIC